LYKRNPATILLKPADVGTLLRNNPFAGIPREAKRAKRAKKAKTLSLFALFALFASLASSPQSPV
jgi:hypothetical protein